MKKILIAALICAACSSLNAQVMASKAVWITIKSANLKCWECREKLEQYLSRENESTMQSGMLQRKYNLLTGELRIQYNPDRTTPAVIRTVMNNAGFDADDEKAEPDSYKTLPPACKRA